MVFQNDKSRHTNFMACSPTARSSRAKHSGIHQPNSKADGCGRIKKFPSKPGASLPTEVDRKWAAGRRCCSIFGLHYIPAERILTLVVSTLAEIEKAVPLLEIADLSNLERFVRAVRLRRTHPARPSAFDLPPLSLGAVRKPLVVEDDLLEEMLNDARD